MKWALWTVGLYFCLMGQVFAQVTESQDQAEGALASAQHSLQAGQGQAAYDSLLPLVASHAGQPQFDLLFGRTALATGNTVRAILAFQRCVAVAPRNGDCRLGLARAYMEVGEKQRAYDSLTAIRALNPPERVSRVVTQYLGQLAGKAHNEKDHFRGWVQLSVGYDNNTNVAPSDSLITLPSSNPNIGISFSSSADSSTFGTGEVNLAWQTALSDHWAVLAGTNLELTRNTQVASNSAFDAVDQLSGYAGVQGHFGDHSVGAVLRAQHYRLSEQDYRNLVGIMGQYGYLISPTTRLSMFLQYSRFDYQYGSGANQQNIDSYSGGVSLLRSVMDNEWLLFGGFYTGTNRKVKDGALDTVSNDYLGLRGGATWFFVKNWEAGIHLLAESRDYDERALFFANKVREDRLLQTSLTLAWQITGRLSMHSAYSYLMNHSNIPTRDFDRQRVSLGVRYDFL